MTEPLTLARMRSQELVGVIQTCHEALRREATKCPYHGTDFGFLGREGDHDDSADWAMPRCDSCKQPWRVMRALDAIRRARLDVVP